MSPLSPPPFPAARPGRLAASTTLLAATALAAALTAPPALPAQERAPVPAADATYDPALFAGLDYRMVGPYRGGRSTAVSGVPGKPFTFLAGTTGGGVWKTTDAGQSWENVSDGFFDVAPVGAIAVAEADPGVIYAGTGSACIRGNVSTGRGVYRSVDGGKTWTFVGLPEAGQVGRIVVHPRNPDLVYVAALGHPFGKNEQRGVFRSRDGGETWEQVLFLSDSTGAVDVAMNPENPREIYAGMWRGQRKPWTLISGSEEGGVYKTTDGGDTWEKLGGGLPEGMTGKVGVTVSPADPDRVWALVEAEPDGGVYRSDDAGKTWTRVNAENKLRQRAWYYTHIYADPRDPHTVYALNTDFYRSVDGGETFREVDVPHGDVHDLWVNPRRPGTMVVANDGGAQVTVNEGRSWSTMNNLPTAELYDVVVDNAFPYHLYGAQQDNTTIRIPAWSSSNTIHAKEHWEYVGGCETGPVALHPDHPDVVYAGCYGGVIDRYDLGREDRQNVLIYPQLQLTQPLRDLRYRFQWVSPVEVSPHDPEVVYHASNHVHRSEDGGWSWETVSPDLTMDVDSLQGIPGGPVNHDGTGVETYNTIFSLRVSPHDPDVLWAGSDDGRVHVTRDGSGTWADVTPPGMPEHATVDAIDPSPHEPGKAYVTAQRYRLDDFAPYVWRTEDYGESWTRIADGSRGIPGDHPVRVTREDPERPGLLFAGTEFGVYVSFDDGGRWQPLQLDLPVSPVTGLRIAHDDLVLSTQGRSFWVLDDMTPLRELSPEVAAADVHLFGPRPAVRTNDYGAGGEEAPEPRPHGAILHYRLAADADSVRLEIVDASGRVATTLTSDTARAGDVGYADAAIPDTAGMHRVTWNLFYPGPDRPEDVVIWGYTGGAKAPPGTYTARLTVHTPGGGSPVVRQRSFEVRPDPRLEIPREEYGAQFRMATAIRDTLDDVWDAVRTIDAAREQLSFVADRADDAGRGGAIRPLADSLRDALYAVKEELTQVRSESGQDPIRYPPMLDNQYVSLYAYVTGTDSYRYGGREGRPPEGADLRFEDLNAEWARHRARLRAILEEDLPRFNRRVDEAGLPAVVVESR